MLAYKRKLTHSRAYRKASQGDQSTNKIIRLTGALSRLKIATRTRNSNQRPYFPVGELQLTIRNLNLCL